MQMYRKRGLTCMEQPKKTGTKQELALYRLQSARETLLDAKSLLKNGSFKSANNRAFYVIFYSINAIHALNGFAYKRHKDAIANFNKEYVKTGVFPREIGRKIAKAELIRHASDYDDFYIATKDEAKEQVQVAEEFLGMVEKYCNETLHTI